MLFNHALVLTLALICGACAGTDAVTISNGQLVVTLATAGAELQSIRHVPTDTEYLWQGDPGVWAGRSPNMFPVNIRFRDNRYTYKGVAYDMPRMGLVRSAAFAVQTDPDVAGRVVHVLESSADTLQHYPFPFRFEIASELDGLELIQRYTVINTGAEAMYFALGGHPGLRTPFIHGRTRADYQIRFSKSMQIERSMVSDSLVTDVRLPFLDDEDRLALDDGRIPDGGMLLLEHSSRKIGIALGNRDPYVTVDLGDFPNTNLWTPPGVPYVCIEPMVGHHDLTGSSAAIDEKNYLVRLAPGASRTFAYRIIVNPEEGARALL